MRPILSIALLMVPLVLAACKTAPEATKPEPRLASLAPAAGPTPSKIIPRKSSAEIGVLLRAWADPEMHASLSDLDRLKNQQAEKRATNAPAGQIVTWSSPATGNSGTIVAVRDAYDTTGTFCREFQQTVTIEGRRKQGRSIACQQTDGSWKVGPAHSGS